MRTAKSALRYCLRHTKQSISFLVLFLIMHQMIFTYLWIAHVIEISKDTYYQSQEYWIAMDGPLLSYRSDQESLIYSFDQFQSLIQSIQTISDNPLVIDQDISLRINATSSNLIPPRAQQNNNHSFVVFGYSNHDDITIIDGEFDRSMLTKQQAIVPSNWYIRDQSGNEHPVMVGDKFILTYSYGQTIGITNQEIETQDLSIELTVAAICDASCHYVYTSNEIIYDYISQYFKMQSDDSHRPIVVTYDQPIFYTENLETLQQLQNTIHRQCIALNESKFLTFETGYHYDSTIVEAKAMSLSLESNFRLIRISCLLLFAVSILVFYLYVNISIKHRTHEVTLLRSLGASLRQIFCQIYSENIILLIPSIVLSIVVAYFIVTPLMMNRLFVIDSSLTITIPIMDTFIIIMISLVIMMIILLIVTLRMILKLKQQPLHQLLQE